MNTYQPLRRICVALMCKLPNIEVWRSATVHFFYNTELNKLVT
jgi:hypothetical protein